MAQESVPAAVRLLHSPNARLLCGAGVLGGAASGTFACTEARDLSRLTSHFRFASAFPRTTVLPLIVALFCDFAQPSAVLHCTSIFSLLPSLIGLEFEGAAAWLSQRRCHPTV
jgi:membrane-bound metal-dependent hydrolase YbcI (DUF457 family)